MSRGSAILHGARAGGLGGGGAEEDLQVLVNALHMRAPKTEGIGEKLGCAWRNEGLTHAPNQRGITGNDDLILPDRLTKPPMSLAFTYCIAREARSLFSKRV